MYQTILLACIDRIDDEKSFSSIYHLLKGKRSAQTIQDAKAYGLSPIFGILKSLTKNQFRNSLLKLHKDEYIEWKGEETVSLTSTGKSYLSIRKSQEPELAWFDGFNLHHIAPHFRLRLLLWIQTASNLLKNHSHFIPVNDQREVATWVKTFYQKKKNQLDAHFASLHEELHQLLKLHQPFHADIFVATLTGFRKIGLSKQQIAEKWNLTIEDAELYLQSSIHFILNKVHQNQTEFPTLSEFIPHELMQLPLTASAGKTRKLLKQGYTIEQISRRRNLKVNTIQDHIVEIIHVDPSYPVDSFVSAEAEQIIRNKISELNTKRLKVIKEQLPESISYFMIRIVMAKLYQSRDYAYA
ncbi:helix-turn-helix domain-containing protein [Salinibacillus aidingensis]|uniref:Helix-turn-helix domain-containing protein n=1 Tax=Salinibacillus aidingensis TaxID=237684 RepID=A0ABN1APL2_9BACI